MIEAKKISLVFISLFCATIGYAQAIWSLTDCIQHAQSNNIQAKRHQITIRQAAIDKKAAQFARLPTANAEVNTGLNFGRTIDPTTNSFINQQVGYNSLNVQTSAIIYNGGRLLNTVKQSQLNIAVAKENAAAHQQNLALEITAAYLDILLAKEQVQIAERQLTQTQEQLTFIDKRIRAEVIPENERLEVLAQIARNTQTVTNAQNKLAISYLALKNYLGVAPDSPLEIVTPKTAATPNGVIPYQLANIYEQAVRTQPSIKASQLQRESAALGIPLAKADRLPSIALVAALRSNYSNVSNFSDAPFFNQFGNNFGQSVALQVNIPIYNNHRRQLKLERAEIAIIDAEIATQQAEQQLKADIQNALTNAQGAKVALEVALSALDAAQNSFQNATKKYQLGVMNTLDYTNIKANVDTAELDVVKAKYDYLFRLKIIEFYSGKIEF
ncbi:MAG: TolC family protein [Bacteroidota bacterium]